MHGTHLVSHIHKPHLVSDNTLHVVGVISNPSRWHSRLRLYRDWAARMEQHPNVRAYTVEAAFGDRHHEITETGHPQHLQLRTRSEIWIKESTINLGERYMFPPNWRYMCWADCDVEFRNPNWALETIHQLQHFAVVQPWQNALDLGPTGNVMNTFTSFGHRHQLGQPLQAKSSEDYAYGHTGFAWACRRDLWEATQGLVDHAILGSGDHHMAFGLIGQVERTIYGGISESYGRRLREWQRRAMRVTHGQVGFVPGRLEHHFHGSKKSRQYQSRWKLLIKHGFDPDQDLMYDPQGLVQLIGKPALEHDIHRYNVNRREDDIGEGCG